MAYYCRYVSDTAGETPVLSVSTQLVDDIRPLVPLVDPRHPLVFIRRGSGIAGIGEALTEIVNDLGPVFNGTQPAAPALRSLNF